jgi:hypothetical protein
MGDVPDRSDVMTKLRRFAIAALAAATVTIGSLATAAPAAAAMSCATAMGIADVYTATGNIFLGLGQSGLAASYYGRARGIMEGACS